MNLVNTGKAKRALGVPGARGRNIRVEIGEPVEITQADREAMEKNATASSWLRGGFLRIEGEAASQEQQEPTGTTPVAEARHIGGGKYAVFVNDERATDDPMSKADAQAEADSYNGA